MDGIDVMPGDTFVYRDSKVIKVQGIGKPV